MNSKTHCGSSSPSASIILSSSSTWLYVILPWQAGTLRTHTRITKNRPVQCRLETMAKQQGTTIRQSIHHITVVPTPALEDDTDSPFPTISETFGTYQLVKQLQPHGSSSEFKPLYVDTAIKSWRRKSAFGKFDMTSLSCTRQLRTFPGQDFKPTYLFQPAQANGDGKQLHVASSLIIYKGLSQAHTSGKDVKLPPFDDQEDQRKSSQILHCPASMPHQDPTLRVYSQRPIHREEKK